MKERKTKPQARPEATGEPTPAESRQETPIDERPDLDERPDKEASRADRRLVERCLAGEVAAWEELYAQCHRPLCSIVRFRLGPAGSDANLVDEIAARVWYALVADDGRLLGRYNPRRGARLSTFLRTVAKDVIGRHFRSEQRRLQRELAALRERASRRGAAAAEPASALAEFLATLTPLERSFCGEYLLATSPEGTPPSRPGQSLAAAWQLRRRIYRKLLGFLGYES